MKSRLGNLWCNLRLMWQRPNLDRLTMISEVMLSCVTRWYSLVLTELLLLAISM